jgi:hypothetical protein
MSVLAKSRYWGQHLWNIECHLLKCYTEFSGRTEALSITWMVYKVTPFYCYAECHYAEGHYAGCHYAEFLYAKCYYAECYNAKCHCAECRGAKKSYNLGHSSQRHCFK